MPTTEQKPAGDCCLWCEGRGHRAGRPALPPSGPTVRGQRQLPPEAQSVLTVGPVALVLW